MPHVSPKGIDLVVSCFIAHPTEPACCLVKHKKLGCWLPVGGHVGDTDPNEDTDMALAREIREETGLILGEDVEIMDVIDQNIRRKEWEAFSTEENPHNSRQLYSPVAVDIHDFTPLPGHRHLAMVFYAQAKTGKLVLSAKEHDEICWVTGQELTSWKVGLAFGLTAQIKYYALDVIEIYEFARDAQKRIAQAADMVKPF